MCPFPFPFPFSFPLWISFFRSSFIATNIVDAGYISVLAVPLSCVPAACNCAVTSMY